MDPEPAAAQRLHPHDLIRCERALEVFAITGQTITVAGGMEGRLLWDENAIDEAAIKDRSGYRGGE